EVNDALPPDMVSSQQIDGLMTLIGGEEIDLVDTPAQYSARRSDSVVPRYEPPTSRPRREADERPSVAPIGADETYHGKSNDPVRMYLRKMGSVSLLTREGEVEIAKRIEDGENRVFEVILNSRVESQRSSRLEKASSRTRFGSRMS